MSNAYFDRLFLNIKIWLIAVAVNALLYTLYMIIRSDDHDRAGEFLGMCFVLGGIFSFPILIAIQVTLRCCIDSALTGKWLFRTMLGVGIGLIVIVVLFASDLAELKSKDMLVLLGVALFSGLAGIASQYSSLIKWGSDFNNVQKV
jgi:hypothetical protein